MVVGNLASRSPWDFSPHANAPTITTAGNNARSAESWQDGGQPGPNQFHPVSATRDYTFPWTNEWFTKDCDPGTPYGANFQVGKSFDVDAAAVNLFTIHNRMHDFAYLLGFTEDNFNSQESNFGLTEAFRENDPVRGDVAGRRAIVAGPRLRQRATTRTCRRCPTGSSSITNMYLWQPVAGAFYPPCVDGDFDVGVIGHEYTHMIENRTIGKGADRTGFQAGAMGEAVGDLFSIEELNEFGLVPTGDENPSRPARTSTGNKLRGIRNYAPNFPYTGRVPEPRIYPQVDPLNFSDVGYDVTGPEVHADGEIWVAINFELRQALAAKYDAQFPESDAALQKQCAAGAGPGRRSARATGAGSSSRSTRSCSCRRAPSMVDARNAILAADQARFGGADQAEIWAAFARRGLGRFASQTNGSGRTAGVESDTNPLPDFEAPGQANANVTFAATSTETGNPAVKARIYVGHYEARVSPIADTDPATNAPSTASANNLDEKATFAPGPTSSSPPPRATARCASARRSRRTDNPTITLRFAPNFASTTQGAQATGDAAPFTNRRRARWCSRRRRCSRT